ncbi:hypothetical protein [Archangium sp.]|uniref:hypothetical protein n=1 Tax=Archangium sp. TaxID=1872627 RepID=UPI002D5851C6|nr:hypothetical protein [Archangium sp.]HYO56251.1 hypothetical protein [Archangium sp.]
MAEPVPGELEIDVHGEAKGFGGQRAPSLTAELAQGRFGSAATVLPRPLYPGLRIEGRYSLLERARRRNLTLVATTTLFPMESRNATIGFDVRLGAVHLFAGIAYEGSFNPATSALAWRPAFRQ